LDGDRRHCIGWDELGFLIVRSGCVEILKLTSKIFDHSDIDECRTENGGCEYRCINNEGGFRCECPPGKQLHSDGKKCVGMGAILFGI
jgi:hypothetical protein